MKTFEHEYFSGEKFLELAPSRSLVSKVFIQGGWEGKIRIPLNYLGFYI